LASAVWNALASQFNAEGTTGATLERINELITQLHRIGGLDSNNPVTTTQTSITAGDIEIGITGDGVNSTTLTRV
jgi:hypothetical protein